MNAFIKVWKFPALLALLTAAGLIAALVGSGLWHYFSWLALATPLAVAMRFGLFLRK